MYAYNLNVRGANILIHVVECSVHRLNFASITIWLRARLATVVCKFLWLSLDDPILLHGTRLVWKDGMLLTIILLISSLWRVWKVIRRLWANRFVRSLNSELPIVVNVVLMLVIGVTATIGLNILL